MDYVATINNETRVPILEAFETIDRTGRWSLISSRFGYTVPDYNEFPQSLAPSVLKDPKVDGDDLVLDEATKRLLSSLTKARQAQPFCRSVHLVMRSLSFPMLPALLAD